MFRNEGYVRSGIFSWWNNLFPSGTYPYAGDSSPLLIVDDLNLASQEDALRWTVAGREGKLGHRYRTVLSTSLDRWQTNQQVRVSEIMAAERVAFRDFPWHATQR